MCVCACVCVCVCVTVCVSVSVPVCVCENGRAQVCAAFVTFNCEESLLRCLHDYHHSSRWISRKMQPPPLRFRRGVFPLQVARAPEPTVRCCALSLLSLRDVHHFSPARAPTPTPTHTNPHPPAPNHAHAHAHPCAAGPHLGKHRNHRPPAMPPCGVGVLFAGHYFVAVGGAGVHCVRGGASVFQAAAVIDEVPARHSRRDVQLVVVPPRRPLLRRDEQPGVPRRVRVCGFEFVHGGTADLRAVRYKRQRESCSWGLWQQRVPQPVPIVDGNDGSRQPQHDVSGAGHGLRHLPCRRRRRLLLSSRVGSPLVGV